MPEFVLKMEHISKHFAGINALDDVSLECVKGEVHVLAGENGAGKSTILKILSGIYQADKGSVTLYGKPVHIKNPIEAQRAGIAMVFQELTLINQLTVAENIFLNIERKKSLVIDKKEQMRTLIACMDEYGIHIDPEAIVDRLSVAQKQLVEILKILIRNPEIIILDEPTSSLAKKEVRMLFDIIHKLVAKGKTIIFISHRLEEIFEIGDKVTVFKDGKFIAMCAISEINMDQLIRMMVGRTLQNIFPSHLDKEPGEALLSVRNLTFKTNGVPIDFEIRKGEILGIAGLQGHGQTELLNALSGLVPLHSGEIYLSGKKKHIHSSKHAIREGIALIPCDRKQEGLLLGMSIRHNIALASMDKRKKFCFIDGNAEKKLVEEYRAKLNIKMANMENEVASLSGGNQQKIVLGKELAILPKVLLFNEPTRGIDVEAKREFYFIMRDLAEKGVAVIMCSNDLMEVIGMSDRVMVMYERKVSAFLERDGINEENIMRCAMGLKAMKSGEAV
jgi:ABC-type sugar transport system ATPase subunit